jgi:anti-sigma regulatory factor (Ser/Thr protein kinase)
VSAGDHNELDLELISAPGSVGVARHAVSDLAERAGADVEAVAVAVSEVVTNAILHAFKENAGDEATIELRAHVNGESLLVEIDDNGTGIKPNPGSPGLGYGLALVASLADEIGIAASPGGGTRVQMRFALTA